MVQAKKTNKSTLPFIFHFLIAKFSKNLKTARTLTKIANSKLVATACAGVKVALFQIFCQIKITTWKILINFSVFLKCVKIENNFELSDTIMAQVSKFGYLN